MNTEENKAGTAPPTEQVRIHKCVASGEIVASEDCVAVEEPLELRVERQPIAVIMRTPGHDDEIAAGFLLSEGVVSSRRDIFEISHCPSVTEGAEGNIIDALLVRANKADLKRLTRNVFTSSSCGICGKGSIEAVHQHFPPLSDCTAAIEAELLARLAGRMSEHQPVFRSTGGLHAAALFRLDGTLVCAREDVGRHNAVDKVLGRALLDDLLPLREHVLLVSGRVSFEIIQKALAARIPIVAGISAATSLAIRFAKANAQTLVGFVRDASLNVYAGPERVLSTEPESTCD